MDPSSVFLKNLIEPYFRPIKAARESDMLIINNDTIASKNHTAEIIGHAWSTADSVMNVMMQLGLIRHGTEKYYLDPKYEWIKELRV